MKTLYEYRISEETGALLPNPLYQLPEGYEPWNALAKYTPELYAKRRLWEYISKLPPLDPSNLMSHEEFRLAHKILAFATSCYVWQNAENERVEVLPSQLAVPFIETSKVLGMQPIITHQDLVLGNCQRTLETGELTCLHQPSLSKGWKPFISISGEIEVAFSPAYRLMTDLVGLQSKPDDHAVAAKLDKICSIIERCTALMSTFYDKLDTKEFYSEIRPILCGWNNGNYSGGLEYAGLKWLSSENQLFEGHCNMKNIGVKSTDADSNVRIPCIGASAAQSITLQSLDALLQIQHCESDRQFFRNMRHYMIKEQRQFILDLERQSNLRDIVLSSTSDQMKQSFENCTQQLRRFRDSHLGLVAKYISKPSLAYAPKVEYIRFKGTGGQSVEGLLLRARDNSV